jgi:EAL domain-containing protein (putative c-di-GMP-specific phosphodiesterase class I)/GGDEF domain-containing protein
VDLLLFLVVFVAGASLARFRPRGRSQPVAPPWFDRLRAVPLPEGVLGAGGFVAILEVDRFATLRRDIGARLANRVLAHVADRIAAELDGCEIGRTGRTSIEFAFVAADVEAARESLLFLVKQLTKRITIDDLTFDLNVLIGAAEANADATREEVLDHAAAAIATAQATRQSVCFADEEGEGGSELDDIALMRDLRRAIEQGELRLHYQPKLRSRTNAIDSAEALLRWSHPTRGPVAIERLIRLAESTGAIRDLTEWVVAQAVADQARLAASGHDLTVYVNISGVLLPDADFAERVLTMVARAKGRIGFEVTETAVIQDPEGALTNLRAFSAAGIKIAIDDYGSGLSSLSYLKQLPANELKIDQMFVSGLIDSHRDPLLVRSSIDLAHALDMEVTAEGVDDPLALSLLRVMGCDLIQGYLISPPIELSALQTFLTNFDHREHLSTPRLMIPDPAKLAG